MSAPTARRAPSAPSDPAWDEFEQQEAARQNLIKRVEHIMAMDPDDRMGLISEKLIIR